ncbi:hypothetical protein ACQ86D_19505 [Streptomyces galilaeus]
MTRPLPGRPGETQVVLGLVAVAIGHFAAVSVVAVVRSRKRRRRAPEV